MLGGKPADVVPEATAMAAAIPTTEALARVASPALDSQGCIAEAELARGER
jgi:hypothetical protein